MINDLAFNQDFSCLLMSTDECHKIFNCDPFGEFHLAQDLKSPTAFLRMLFSTSLTIIVPQTPEGNRVLKVYNLKQKLKICELTFPLDIVDLMLNRKRLVVFLAVGQIYIYDLSTIRLIKVLEVNAFADEVVADLSASDTSYLALPVLAVCDQTDLFNTDAAGCTDPGTPVLLRPADLLNSLDPLIEFTLKNAESALSKRDGVTLHDLQKDSGWILVYDTIHLRPRLLYKAHDLTIAKIAISNSSQEIATASAKGTILRVCHLSFDLLQDFQKLKITHVTNLRRGHNFSTVHVLKFNLDATILGCGLESNTIHFFHVAADHSSTEEEYSSDDDDDAKSGRSSLEDLNENLANLLVLKQPESPPEPESYFSAFRSSKLLNNLYTKLLMKKLPYRDYLDNLIWSKPRRSFAYIKLPEHLAHAKNVEIGFSSSGLLMLASYSTGMFYHYTMPKYGGDEREKCALIALHSLVG